MALTRLKLVNFTVFSELDMEFSPGINVLIGENSTGKTHVLKVLYSACQAAQAQTTTLKFNQKLVRVFRPDSLKISRLVKRGKGSRASAITVISSDAELNLYFHFKSKEWNAEIKGEKNWEKQAESLVSIFIPSKDILSNAQNLPSAIDQSIVAFDDTYKDIIQIASVGVPKGREPLIVRKYAKILHNLGTLSVDISDEAFYIRQGSQAKLEFNLVSEGIRKIALLLQLVKNGAFAKGTVLFWDEPEANINPRNYPILAEMLLELQRDGVQVFISTHDYFFARYLDVRKKRRHEILYHALYTNGSSVEYEKALDFEGLTNNVIIDQSINLYKEEVWKVME